MNMETKKYYYHGTSADNLKSILKNGLPCSESKIWNCSENKIYLWDFEAVGKEFDAETDEDNEMYAFKMASESAQLAICAAKDCRLVVIKVLLSIEEIEQDLSCENMEGRGAVCINRNITASEIVEIKISNDLSLIKGYFLALLKENQYNGLEFSPLEDKIADCFKKAEIYPEDIDDMIQWEEIPIKRSKKQLA